MTLVAEGALLDRGATGNSQRVATRAQNVTGSRIAESGVFIGGFHIPPAVSFPIDLFGPMARFQNDHPDGKKCAFVMMRFMDTALHKRIFNAIRAACKEVGLIALRADEHRYSDYLWHNVQTYMYGCALGIAVFERLAGDDFNPNISLELGFMLALGKPVCLLKDSTLPALHTDLVGSFYEPFEVQSPETTIRKAFAKWHDQKR